MKLLVSVSKWGVRKGKDIGKGGLYLIDFERKQVLHALEIPVESDSSRALSGITLNDGTILAAHPKNSRVDSILSIDAKDFSIIEEKTFDGFSDLHQIDLFDGLLWVTNTNYNEVVAINPESWQIAGTWCIDKTQKEERLLKKSLFGPRPTDRDHRGRIHLNTILIREGFLDIGHFGIDKGRFNSSQLTRVEWFRGGKHIRFGNHVNLPFSGYVSPHNAMMLPDGEKFVCDSFHGSLIVGDREIKVGGWTRGVALSKKHIYVGRSSYSYDVIHGAVKTHETGGVPIAIFKIDREQLAIVDEFLFSNVAEFMAATGQLYDIRIMNGEDL